MTKREKKPNRHTKHKENSSRNSQESIKCTCEGCKKRSSSLFRVWKYLENAAVFPKCSAEQYSVCFKRTRKKENYFFIQDHSET